MPHVIEVWAQPPRWIYPRQAGTVLDMLARLRTQRTGQSPQFIAFTQQLAVRDPAIVPVSPGPNGAASAVQAIALPAAPDRDTLTFIGDSARALGLSLFDAQAGRIWLANGEPLRVDGEHTWTTFEPAYIEIGRALPDKDALLDRLLAGAAGKVLAGLGFEPLSRDPRDDVGRSYTSMRLRRLSAIGWQEIELRGIDDRPAGVKLSVRVECWATPVSNWRLETHLAPSPVPPGTRPLCNLSLMSQRWMNDTAGVFESRGAGNIVLRSEDDIARATTMLASQCRERLAPLLTGFDGLRALADLLVPADLPFEWSPFFAGHVNSADALVAAYLARSPRLPTLIDEVRARAQPKQAWGNNPARHWLAQHDEAMWRHVQACIVRMEREPLARH